MTEEGKKKEPCKSKALVERKLSQERLREAAACVDNLDGSFPDSRQGPSGSLSRDFRAPRPLNSGRG